ncbi:MAG: hypothetical protein ACK5NC_04135 [Vibrio sp.]
MTLSATTHAEVKEVKSVLLSQPSDSSRSDVPTQEPLDSSVEPQQSKYEKKNKEVWNHILPFGGQQAVYNGYDLPLPFGISFLYSQVRQHQKISDIRVGANKLLNKDKLSIPMQDIDYDLFHFDNFYTESKTPQLKIDAWVLPFLNVFGTVGKLNGEADLDMTVGGQRIMNGIHQTAFCQKHRFICRNKHPGDDISIHASPEIDGYTYTFGALIAGGYNDWFYTIPVTYTQTHMHKTTIDGQTINVQPRVGYRFDMDYGTRLMLYTGAAYMKIDQDISGSFSLDEMKAVPDNPDNGVPFSVHQENQDYWSGIVGVSLDVTKYFSSTIEYTGIGGDREAFLFIFNVRF